MMSSAPDGGWGWVVVFAYFWISVITDGIRYSFGIMFISLLEAFGKGSGETAWVAGLLAGTCNIIGPVVTKLTDKYGCRTIAVAGSLIASLGFLISVFAQYLYQLYITLGVTAGIGYGMIFLPSIVSVSRYFDKKRSLAMGISVCGSGVGAIIFNPLSKWLLDGYGWRGTILIETALILNCVAFSFLYRPLSEKCLTEPQNSNRRIKKGLPLLQFNEIKRTDVKKTADDNTNIQLTELGQKYNVPDVDCSLLNNEAMQNEYELKVSAIESKRFGRRIDPDGDTGDSLNFIQKSQEEENLFGVNNRSEDTKKATKLTLCIEISREMIRFSLLKDPSFLIFFVSTFLISIAYSVPYTYLPDLATKLGYTRSEGALLISYLGISNTASRVIFGIIGDLKKVNRLYMYIITLIICGIFTAFVPVFSLYGLLVMYAAVYGMTIAGYVSLSNLVVRDLFSLEVLTESVGLSMFACGFAAFLGPPIAGWLFDATGSYSISFISTGVALILSGVILFVIPCIRRKKNKI